MAAAGLLGISVLYLGTRHVVLGGSEQTGYLAGSLFATLVQMGPVVLRYLRLFLFRVNQLADYIHQLDHPASLGMGLASWGIVGAIAASFLCACRKNPVLLFAGVWLVTAMLPVLNIVPMMQYMAERFVYLPMVGMCLIAGICLDALQDKSASAVRVTGVVILIALTGLIILQRLDREA